MVEYYRIPIGAMLLPPVGQKLKYVGFVTHGTRTTEEMEIQECSRPFTDPGGYAQEIIFRIDGSKKELMDLIDKTVEKFGVQKIVWRHPPLNFYDTVNNKLWSEATCYLIIEGETNAEKL